MIIEERVYTLHPGKMPEYLRNLEENGWKTYRETLGQVIGVFTAEIGPLNEITSLAVYNNFQDRADRRDRLKAADGWEQYAKSVRPLIASQRNRILLPTAFSPLR